MGSRASACSILWFSIVLALNFSSIGCVSSSSCASLSPPFLYDVQLQCPLSISSSRPIQVNGEALDQVLTSKPSNVYTAVLFYASWCPFSASFRNQFGMLSSVYPQVEHIEVEHSSAMPSLLSRYGVRSLPSIFIINQTSKVRFHGQKDLRSLARFYQKTTGLNPVGDFTPPSSSGWLTDQNQNTPLLWYQSSSLREMIAREPYLLFSTFFLTLRTLLYFCPQLLKGFLAVWSASKRHLNLGVFGESSHLLGRVMQVIDLKRVWNKLKWCQTRNFHRGARSARVWASSLASVSLGETSSVRSTMLES